MAWPPDVADDVDVILASHTNLIKNSVKLWQGEVDANNNRLFNVTSIDQPPTLAQKLNLWAGNYGIGVQNPAVYFRSAGHFCWYVGGVHHDTAYNAGAGGAARMALTSSGNLLIGTTTEIASERIITSGAPGNVTIRSTFAAGTGISPILNLENAATNITDGVEIRHTAGSLRGQIRLQVGDSPFGSDLLFISNGTTRFRCNSNGRVVFVGLPTSSAGLTPGELWRDAAAGNVIKQIP